jgi:hypothetical protein
MNKKNTTSKLDQQLRQATQPQHKEENNANLSPLEIFLNVLPPH